MLSGDATFKHFKNSPLFYLVRLSSCKKLLCTAPQPVPKQPGSWCSELRQGHRQRPNRAASGCFSFGVEGSMSRVRAQNPRGSWAFSVVRSILYLHEDPFKGVHTDSAIPIVKIVYYIYYICTACPAVSLCRCRDIYRRKMLALLYMIPMRHIQRRRFNSNRNARSIFLAFERSRFCSPACVNVFRPQPVFEVWAAN